MLGATALATIIFMSGLAIAGPLHVLAYAGDGSGTVTVSPNTNLIQGTRYTLSFTYTAATGGMSNGAVTLGVPPTWPIPSSDCIINTPNYVTAIIGSTYQSVSVPAPLYRTIVVSGVTLSGGQTMTIKYADTLCHGHGLGPSSSGGTDTWLVQQESTSSGVLTNIAASPTVSVLAPNGTGTLTTTTGVVATGSSGNVIPFTFAAPPGGMNNGEVTVTVPQGWSAPSTTGTAPGYTTSSTGSVAVASQTVSVTGLTLNAGATFTITYGSKASGGPGATAPSTPASQTWQAQQESSASVGPLTNIAPVAIQVGAPPAAYGAAAGVGDSSISSPTGRGVSDSGLPINAESGELYTTAADVSIRGLGPGLTVGRAYNSGNASANGPFGYGWSSDLTMSLVLSGGGSVATITDESGAPVTFTLSGSTWTGAAYNASTLANSSGVWTYQRWNGRSFNFNSSGQLTSVSDRNANITTLVYTSGQLSSVSDASGRSLGVTWTGSNITKITDPLQQSVQYGYDGSGNLATFTNQANIATHYTYDSHHNLQTIQDPVGNFTTAAYSSSAPYTVCWIFSGSSANSCSSPPSGSTTLTYSSPRSNQTATQVVDPSGHSVLFTYDHGLLIQKIQGYGTSLAAPTAYSYDPITLGLTLQLDANGVATSIQRDSLGNQLSRSITDFVAPNGSLPLTSTTTYTYNSLNEPLTIVAADGNVPGCNCASSYTTTDSYDATGDLLTTTDAVGNVTTNAYNSVGERCWTFVGASTNACGTPPTGSTAYVYDAYGDVLSSTDGLGDQTTHTYDILGRQTTTVTPDGNVSGCGCTAAYTTTTPYNPLNKQCWSFVGSSTNTCSTPPSGATVFTYDNNANLLTSTDPAGAVKTTAYDSHNRVCWTYAGAATPACGSPPSGSDVKTYTPNGQLATETTPDGTVTTNVYNALNQLCWSLIGSSSNSCASPPSGASVYSYDLDSNLLSTTDPVGSITTTAYRADGLACWSYVGLPAAMGHDLCTDLDWHGGVTRTYYDPSANVTGTIQPDGVATSFAYNGDAQKCWSDPSENQSGACATPPNPSLDTIYAYDASGNLKSTTYPSGAVVTQAYNVVGELCWVYSGGSSNTCSSPPTGATTYAYDANGQKVTRVDSTGTTRWTYDNHGDETSMTSASGVTYGYDSVGNQTSITYPAGGVVVTNAYNSKHEVCWTFISTSVSTNQCSSPPTGATTYTYDNNGNLKTAALPNGVTNSWNYDATGALSSISDMKGGTTVFAATYTRTSSEMITQDTSQPSGKQSYRFTPQNQLCYQGSTNTPACSAPPSGAFAYTMDASGNPILNNGVTQTFNAGNELCWTVGGSSTNSCSSPPTGARTFTYDTNSRRASLQPPSGPATCYSYDSNNELTTVQSGTGTSCSSPTTVASYTYNGDQVRVSKTVGSATTSYVWDDSASMALLLQEASASNVTSYVYGPSGQPLAEVLATGTYYYALDALNSIRAVTDASGTVKNTYTYDPYGNITASSGSTQNHLLYAAQYQDSETGFYYLRARYYDPVTAQFLTIDPLVSQTLSPYTYTSGDPVDNADPTGQWQFSATAYAAWKDFAFIPLTSMWLTMLWNTNGWRVTGASGYVLVEAHDGGWTFGRWQLDWSNFGIWWSGGCVWSCGSLSLTSKAGFWDPGGAFNWWGDWYNTLEATITVFGPWWTYRVGLWLREDFFFRKFWGAWWGSPWNAPWWARP